MYEPTIWTFLISAVASLVQAMVYGTAPAHQDAGIAMQVATVTNSTLGLLFMTIFGNVNMSVPIGTLGIILILEGIRSVYAAWRWFKRIVV